MQWYMSPFHLPPPKIEHIFKGWVLWSLPRLTKSCSRLLWVLRGSELTTRTESFDSLYNLTRADVTLNPHYFSIFLKHPFSFLELTLLVLCLYDSLFEKPYSSQPTSASLCHGGGEPCPELGLPLASISSAISVGSCHSATLLILSA